MLELVNEAFINYDNVSTLEDCTKLINAISVWVFNYFHPDENKKAQANGNEGKKTNGLYGSRRLRPN